MTKYRDILLKKKDCDEFLTIEQKKQLATILLTLLEGRRRRAREEEERGHDNA